MPNYIGFSNLNRRLSSRYNSSYLNNLITSNNNIISAVRVVDILLDNSDPALFKTLGEWNGLGTIEFQEVNNPLDSPFYSTASPLNPNSKNFPLINEIVFLITLPDTGIGGLTSASKSYYINPVALWNHPHHNAYPLNIDTLPPSQQQYYVQTALGSVRRVTDQSTKINLGKTFIEKSNIHPLLPFEGDVIYEGRWGNSIRLSSTIKDKESDSPQNDWSQGDSTSGDPIIVIRNGQGDNSPEGWLPITEDINKDLSSIYLTSTQKIDLTSTSTDYTSYNDSGYDKPTNSNVYSNKQIILNSGRLVFNSSEDHILLSSAKSINLNSLESVNIDTNKFITSAEKILLGPTSQATEPLLLGDTTVQFLRELTRTLKALNSSLAVLTTTTPSPGSPIIFPDLQKTTAQIAVSLALLDKKLGTKETCTLTSKNNFTR